MAGLGLLPLFGAGMLAGAMNSLAGGGSFVSLPALIAAGIPSVQANASSTVALWPGGVAGAWTYHERFRTVCGLSTTILLGLTLVGGLIGSVLLLVTPSSVFNVLLPWLLLMATLALAFARRIGQVLEGRLRGHRLPVMICQLGLGMYGGYFGGAVGLMMVSVWGLFGERDIKALNAPRTLLVVAANTVAVVTFVVAGAVVVATDAGHADRWIGGRYCGCEGRAETAITAHAMAHAGGERGDYGGVFRAGVYRPLEPANRLRRSLTPSTRFVVVYICIAPKCSYRTYQCA